MLYQNIVLSGGSTLFKGFGDRLLSEIRKHSPKDLKIRVSIYNLKIIGYKSTSVYFLFRLPLPKNVFTQRGWVAPFWHHLILLRKCGFLSGSMKKMVKELFIKRLFRVIKRIIIYCKMLVFPLFFSFPFPYFNFILFACLCENLSKQEYYNTY